MHPPTGRSIRFLVSFGAALVAAPLIAQTSDWREAASEVDQLIAKSRRLGGEIHANKAREVLAPWWNLEDPPASIRLQRATLLQRDHHFEEALNDLNVVLKANPKSTEAWLMKSTILTVMGRYEEARRASIPLFGLAPPLIALTAGTAPTSCHGELRKSYEMLNDTVVKRHQATPAVQAWAQTALAEMAVRLGQRSVADDHFCKALLIDHSSPYLLNAYAYFLLDQEQPERVLGLLDSIKEHLPLPWLIAEKEVNGRSQEYQRIRKIFQQKKQMTHSSHGHSHGREEAIYFLLLENDPREALHHAEANWESQREAADLLILLQAAIAAEDEVTLASTLEWIDQKGFEDERLDRLKKSAQKIIGG